MDRKRRRFRPFALSDDSDSAEEVQTPPPVFPRAVEPSHADLDPGEVALPCQTGLDTALLNDAGIELKLHKVHSIAFAGTILAHCLIRIEQLKERIVPPVVFKIGIACSLTLRFDKYREEDQYEQMWVLHKLTASGRSECWKLHALVIASVARVA